MFEIMENFFRPIGLYPTLATAISAAPRDAERHLICDRTPGGWSWAVCNGVIVWSLQNAVNTWLATINAGARSGKYGMAGITACEYADQRFWERWERSQHYGGSLERRAWESDFHNASMSLLWRGSVEPPEGENICPAMGY